MAKNSTLFLVPAVVVGILLPAISVGSIIDTVLARVQAVQIVPLAPGYEPIPGISFDEANAKFLATARRVLSKYGIREDSSSKQRLRIYVERRAATDCATVAILVHVTLAEPAIIPRLQSREGATKSDVLSWSECHLLAVSSDRELSAIEETVEIALEDFAQKVVQARSLESGRDGSPHK